jgi:YVTN family beta-propeller protein
MSIKKHVIFFLLAFVMTCLFAGSALSDVRWVNGTEAEELLCIMADPIRDRIYYGNGDTNQVVIIDTNTETLIGSIPVAGKPLMLDISKDGKKMAVAHWGLSIIDLDTLQVTQLSVDKEIVDVAFDHSGQLYATTSDYEGYVLKINSATGNILLSFGTDPELQNPIYSSAMVETDKTGEFLYLGEGGVSLYKFDIRGNTPIFLAENEGSLGSNLKQIAIHPSGEVIYLACGYPYEIQEIDAETMNRINGLPTGAYPTAVALDRCGTVAYACANSQNYLFKFDLSTKVLLNKELLLFELSNDDPQPRGIAVDRTDTKVFIIHGETHPSYKHMKIQVVTEITDNNPPSKPELVYPAINQTGLGTEVTFIWKKSTDPDGDAIAYNLYVCEDQSFAGCNPIYIASLYENRYFFAGISGLAGLLVVGIMISGGISKRRKIRFFIAVILVTGVLIVSCGGGDGEAPPDDGPPQVAEDELSYTMSGLNAGAIYYWKVLAVEDCKGGTTESDTWNFTTQ